MKLNDMSRDDLAWLVQSLAGLDRLGDSLQAEALQVRFDLTPGLPARVILPELFTMPGFDMLSDLMRSHSELVDADLALMDKDDVSELADLVEDWDQLPDTDPKPIDEIPAQVKADPNPPTVQDSAGEDGRGSILSGAADQPRMPKAAAPELVAPRAEPPQPMSQPATKPQPVAEAQHQGRLLYWTPARDAELIDAVAMAKVTGVSWAECWRRVANLMSNTPKAIELRSNQYLRDRIAARIADLQAAEASTEATPDAPPQADPVAPTQADAAEPVAETVPVSQTTGTLKQVAPAAPAAASTLTPTAPISTAPTDELGKYLFSLSRKNGWDLVEDHQLLDLGLLGWPIGDVATEMGRQVRDLRARLDLLTCNQHFRREDVLARLATFLTQAAAE